MSHCLTDRALLLLYEGEGTHAQRRHLETCATCRSRCQQLRHDLRLIDWVLQAEPPPEIAAYRPRRLVNWFQVPLRGRWVPAAAALAVCFAVVWGGLWLQRVTKSDLVQEPRNERVWSFLNEVSTALFLPEEALAGESHPSVEAFPDVSAAFGEEWPCEGKDMDFPFHTDDLSFFLPEADPAARHRGEVFDEDMDDFGGFVFPLLCGRPV